MLLRTAPVALSLMTAGWLAGCATAHLTSPGPAVATRPVMKMTQTDFVIRVVNYSCTIPGCVIVGQRNANLGTPGVRRTIRDMCIQQLNADGPATMDCFAKATMSVGDPGLTAVWESCVTTNKKDFPIACYNDALTELINQGADVPIVSMIPDALTDPGAAGLAGGPSCVELITLVQGCEAPQEAQVRERLIKKLPERLCAEQLTAYESTRAACVANVRPKRPGAVVAGSAATGLHVFLSAIAIDARLSKGLLVTEVVNGSGPHRAGLRPGDVITVINGVTATLAGWSKAHVDAGLGGTLRVAVKHTGQAEELEWTVAKCDHPSCVCKREECTRPGDAPQRQSARLVMKGTRVDEALAGGGRAAGIQAGDEIVSINEVPVRDANSLVEIMGQLPLGTVVNVVYARGGKETTVAVKLTPQ